MSTLKNYLPESCYKLENLSFSDVQKAFEANETVVGFVESISSADERLTVRLGDDVIAYLPFDEVTIYQLSYSKNNPGFPFPLQVGCLKEKNICAKVISISNTTITLSRKASMSEAYEAIKGLSKLPFTVTAVRAKTVFGDVGHGIQAKILVSQLCKCRIRSATEVCKVGDSFVVAVLNFDELKRVNVSYKSTFPEYNPDQFTKGEVVVGTINEPIDNSFSGYYVNISPQVAGILDYHTWLPILNYGDTVECIVSKASPKGLHLKFLKLL